MKIRSKQRADENSDCPYCRDPCDDAAPRCSGCDVAIHLECLSELTRCSSLGCPTQPRDFVLQTGESPRFDLLSGAAPRWKLALRRSLPLGVGFAAVLLLPLIGADVHAYQVAGFSLMGLLFGLVTVPGSWVEFHEASRKPHLPRQLLGAATSALAASVTVAATFAVGELILQLGKGASIQRAVLSSTGIWEHLVRHPDMANAVVLAGGVLGLVTLLRLRGVPLLKQVGLSLLGAAILGGLLSLVNPMRGFGRAMFAAMGGVGALLVPAASWLLESLRWPAWLGRRSGPPRSVAPKEESSDS
jgi:hypothetical protein